MSNRKLAGSKRRGKQMPGAGEHLAVRGWSPEAALALKTDNSPSVCTLNQPHPSFSESLSESGLCNPRNKIKTAKQIWLHISAFHSLATWLWASQLNLSPRLLTDCLQCIYGTPTKVPNSRNGSC